ncbi:MAG: hypothetical protein WD830_07820 [Chloroflexota bacterium]
MEATPERETDLIERARHGDVSAFEGTITLSRALEVARSMR